MHNKTLHMIAFLLLVVGGLNWLAVGVLGTGIAAVTDQISPVLTQVVYVLVGASAIYEVLVHKSVCRDCGGASASAGM